MVVLLTNCSDKKEVIQRNAIPKVEVRELISTQENENLSYSGTIEADNIVLLGFSIPGRVSKVLVQEGQKVKKGQLLASVDAVTFQSAFEIAKAGLEQANDNFKRLKSLYEKGSLPERDFIAVKVSVAQANANSKIAAKNLADTKLYAPFSGTITAKMIEIGATAAPGLPAFTIMKTDKVFAKAAITESEISKLKIGEGATVIIPSINKTVSGKVTIINHSADAITRTFNVKVKLDNSDYSILPGMISNIKIETNNSLDVLTIPSNAVVRDPDDIIYAYVLRGEKAKRQRISVSSFKGKEVIVTSGLQLGDKVIVAGQRNLKDGQTVTL